MAARRSTHAKQFAQSKSAILLIQDEFFDVLYSGEIRRVQDFVKYSARVRDALSLHIQDLLTRVVSVILDFPGNTRVQRHWFREIFEGEPCKIYPPHLPIPVMPNHPPLEQHIFMLYARADVMKNQ